MYGAAGVANDDSSDEEGGEDAEVNVSFGADGIKQQEQIENDLLPCH